MKKPTKFVIVHVVQGKYESGWEDECCSEKWKEAKSDVKSYRENVPNYQYRIISRRVLRENYETGNF